VPSTRLQLRVSPGASRSAVVGRHSADPERPAWKLRVSAPPEDGKANKAVVRLLADTLSLPRTDVTIVAGHAARDKVVSVAGLDPDETDRRLALAAWTKPDPMLGKDAT